MRVTAKAPFIAWISLLTLAACGADDVILPGERFDIRPQTSRVNQSLPLESPKTQVNADWGHRNGSPAHTIPHPALAPMPAPLFDIDIGMGNDTAARITSHPVVAGGIIYTVDARARVTAATTGGDLLWTRDLTPASDDQNDASGGGISVAAGRVYVSTGFGELSALDGATGATIWVQNLQAPANAAPTVRGDLVYLVARDSTAWALNTATGRIRWQRNGASSTANFAGGASVATDGEHVLFPFPSGEVLATFPDGGLRQWSTFVTGDRIGNAAAVIDDIGGDPVIVGDRAYIGNVSGRTAAVLLEDGSRIWTATEGAVGPVWPVDNAVFLISDQGQLVRLDAATGDAVWRVPLPVFADPERTRREKQVFAHFGPVLAGGRLIVTSSDGFIRFFDPVSGTLTHQIALPSGAASGPVVAGRTLYVLSTAGRLHAYR